MEVSLLDSMERDDMPGQAERNMTRGIAAFALPVAVMAYFSQSVAAPMATLAAGLVTTWLMCLWYVSNAGQTELRLQQALRRVEELNSELELARRTIEQVGRIDALTGLFNRAYMEEMLRREWARAERLGAPLAVIHADLDCFHEYREGHSQASSDILLYKVGKALQSAIKRPADLLARVQEGQFVVILPDTDLDGATLIAERLRDAVEAMQQPHGYSHAAPIVTLSAGVAIRVPTRQASEADLLFSADHTLDGARKAGGNRVVPLDMAA